MRTNLGSDGRRPGREWRRPHISGSLRLQIVGEHVTVDSDGLLSHAGVCDTAAAAIRAAAFRAAAPSAAGHLTQATTAAVAQGHALIDAIAARLSERATATGTTLCTAAGKYAGTDSDSAQSISTTVQV